MPMTVLEKAKNKLAEPEKIDLRAKIEINKCSSTSEYNPSLHNYKCTCCGRGFTKREKYFYKTKNVLYQANDGFLPFCKDCANSYYKQLVNLFSGNDVHALNYFCQQVDWEFSLHSYSTSRNTSEKPLLGEYAKKKNLKQPVDVGTTYIEYKQRMYERNQEEIVTSREQVRNNSSVSMSAVDRWGVGFSDIDYKNLDDHYKMLKKNNPNCDSNQEIFIKTLCNLNMLMSRALRENDTDRYIKLSNTYSQTFAKAGLKTIEEKDASSEQCFGVTLAEISQYTPEEFYSDKELYKDWDKIGEYYERHVLRPTINLLTGSETRDSEYFVPGDEVENGTLNINNNDYEDDEDELDLDEELEDIGNNGEGTDETSE